MRRLILPHPRIAVAGNSILGTYKNFDAILPIFVPITSPETTISTRRFLCLPSVVELSATGVVSPNPRDVTLVSESPC